MSHSGNIYVDGQWQTGDGDDFQSLNPATREVIWEGTSAGDHDIDKAFAAARRAWPGWSAMEFDQRETYLKKFAEALSNVKEEFALLISRETGKPHWESLTEVGAMVRKIEISIQAYGARCRIDSASMGEATRYTRFKPHGVIAVFGPFNLPGHLPNGHIVPALLAGNAVLFKPSELTPAVGQKMTELWEGVHLPPGVLNLVPGGKETGISLLRHKALDGLYFTGSSETGKAIHSQFAGRPEKILALEMGGNNPLIVYDVRDTKAAAYLTIQSSFITSGQRCVCARRVIIPEGKEGDAFLNALIPMTKKIHAGAYSDNPEPFMGPVISEQAGQSVLASEAELKAAGGKILLKLKVLDDNPAMLSCGIMDVTEIGQRPDREIFGPFVQIIRTANFQAAIEEANRTAYGLAAGLLSDNATFYKQFFRQSRAGIVNWNRQTTGASSEAPFGGIGQSGNHHPSAYFAADYCVYPVASVEQKELKLPEKLLPGIDIN